MMMNQIREEQGEMIYEKPDMYIISFSEEDIRCDLTTFVSGSGQGGYLPDAVSDTTTEQLEI